MLLVNLYGAPGSGKSTTRAGVFNILKGWGVNCEEVPEFAKRLTWERRDMALGVQPYVFGKQLRDISILRGQVDVCITDSPLMLSTYYGRKYSSYPQEFYDSIRAIHHTFINMNVMIKRVKPYNPAGRNQTEEESIQVGKELDAMLVEEGITMDLVVAGNENAKIIVANEIMRKLEQ